MLKWIRMLGDPGRIRMLRLLQLEELSVAELQEILAMGQSRISMQLSLLREAGLVAMRKSGQKSLYRFTAPADSEVLISEMVRRSAAEMPESDQDDAALQLALKHRKDHLRSYFDELAGRFGRHYVPGQSWKALAETLFRLAPPLVVADIGAGDGTMALLFARSASRVIAVDSSERMIEAGMQLAARHSIENIEYRLGDIERLPIEDGLVDIALMHQTLHHAPHPPAAVAEAYRVLRPGGRIAVLDLARHEIDAARDLYGDLWLGFTQAEMTETLSASGFVDVDVAMVDRADEPPYFATLLAVARRPMSV